VIVDVAPLQFFLTALAGWLSRQQQDVIGCLDWLLILNQQHLERILEMFVDHYNGHRPHRALSLAPPEPKRAVPVSASALGDACILRRDAADRLCRSWNLTAIARHLRRSPARIATSKSWRRLLQFVALQLRSNEFKELEIVCCGTNSPSSSDERAVRQ
jgi:hypothetical protein